MTSVTSSSSNPRAVSYEYEIEVKKFILELKKKYTWIFYYYFLIYSKPCLAIFFQNKKKKFKWFVFIKRAQDVEWHCARVGASHQETHRRVEMADGTRPAQNNATRRESSIRQDSVRDNREEHLEASDEDRQRRVD